MSRYGEVGLKRLGTRCLSFKLVSTTPSFTAPVDSTTQREISSSLIGMYSYIRGLLLASKDGRTASPGVPVELSLTSLSTASSSARFHLVRKKEDRRGAKDLSDPANRATADGVDHFGCTPRLVVWTTPQGADHFGCTPRLVVWTTPRGADHFGCTPRLMV